MATTVETRRFQILQHLSHSDVASVTDLSNLFGVSEMTIRRDLDALADEGLVHRMRGGAAVANRARRQLGERGLTLERHIEPDVVIINPMEPRMARMIVQEASQRGAPIISESTLFQGSTTLVAIDSFRAGVSLGEWVGRYVRDRFEGQARVLFVGFPSFWDTAERQRGFFEGLRGIVPDPEFSLSVNGQGVRDESRAMVEAALLSYPDVNIIIGSNDQSALGALDALRHLGMRVDGILIGTFGLEGPEGRRELMLRCPRSVGVAMFPELIGRVCLDVAIKAYNRLPLPGHVVTPTVVVTGETLCDYYDCCEDHWTIRWDVVQGLPKEIWSRDAALLSRDQAREFPRVVDFVRYLHDEYYDQLTGGLEQRAAEFGITLRVTDASADLAAGIDQARRAIGKAAANLVRAGEAVMLDAGSTNAYLAQELARRRGENFTVITHSLPVIEALKNAAHITLIGIGGIFHRESQAFLATNAGNVLAGLRVDRAFLGVTGLSVEHGISNIDLAQTDFKRWIIEIAKEVVLVADSLKIGEVALTRIGPISAADKLVTDDQISSRDRLAFAQAGLEVIVATRNG